MFVYLSGAGSCSWRCWNVFLAVGSRRSSLAVRQGSWWSSTCPGIRGRSTRCGLASLEASPSLWRRTARINTSCSDCCRGARRGTPAWALLSGFVVFAQFAVFLLIGLMLAAYYHISRRRC